MKKAFLIIMLSLLMSVPGIFSNAQESAEEFQNRLRRAASEIHHSNLSPAEERAKSQAVKLLPLESVTKVDPKKQKELEANYEKDRQAKIAELTQQIKDKKGNKQELVVQINKLKASKKFEIGELGPAESLDVGKIGYVSYWDYSTKQENPDRLKVAQVISDKELIVGFADKFLLLRGFSVKKIDEEQYIFLECPVEITETKKMKMPDGSSKTVMIAEPLIYEKKRSKSDPAPNSIESKTLPPKKP